MDALKYMSRFLIFFIIVFFLDRGSGYLLGKMHANTRGGGFGGKINAILAQRNEIVVFGSSRAQHHYVASVIATGTGMTVYNAGLDAQHLLCHFAVENLMLDEYTPKIIILDLNATDIATAFNEQAFERLAVLLPYYRLENPTVNALIERRSSTEKIRLLSRSYPYNSQILGLLKYNFLGDRIPASENNGYVPYHGSDLEVILKSERNRATLNGPPFQLNDGSEPVDVFLLDVLRGFVTTAQSKGIKVVLCSSPIWLGEGSETLFLPENILETYKEVSLQLNVPYIELTSNTVSAFENPNLYKDRIHLNDDGARLFSFLLSQRLEEL